MSQRNIDSDEAARWKSKFLDALEDQEKRERGFNNRIKLLRRGLVGVSLAGDGLDTELDRELASLRSSLRAEGSESGFEVLFERIEKSVLRLDTRKEQSSEALQAALNHSVAQLQILDLSGERKREIRKFSKSLQSKIRDAQNHPELIVEYLEILKAVVTELSGQIDPEDSDQKQSIWRRIFTGSSAPKTQGNSSTESSLSSPSLGGKNRENAAALRTHSNTVHSRTVESVESTRSVQQPEPEMENVPVVSATNHSLDLADSELAPEAAADSHEPTASAPASASTQATQASAASEGRYEELEPGFSVIANHAEPVLLRILENIYVSDQSVALANKIKIKVAGGLNWYEFVAVLEDISSVITASLGRERAEFQEFLNELNTSLEQVQEYVQSSRESDAEARTSDEAMDIEVRNHVAGIAESVRKAENIQELKHSVQGQLEVILQSMDDFKEVKQEHHQSVYERAQVLEERITIMEKESAELKDNLAQQEEQALRDALTGLPNRAAYDRWIKNELEAIQAPDTPGTVVVVCDVDHFKKINDTYGHLAGDKVLKILAKEISSRIRKTDFLARYGGEEFVLMLPNVALEDASALVEPIREAIANCPFHFKETQVQITMSFGLAQYVSGMQADQVFERADKALYQAKATGRNRVCTEHSESQNKQQDS